MARSLAPRTILGLALVAACAPRAGEPPHLAEAPKGPPAAVAAAQAAPPIPAVRADGYAKPPKDLLDVLHAPSPAQPYVSPTGDRVLFVAWVDYPSMARVAEPFLKLAGVRVEPRTRRKHDTPGGYGVTPCARSFTLTQVATGAEVAVTLPADGCAEAPLWSADGKRFAFRSAGAQAVELFVGDAETGAVRAVPGARLNPMLGSTVQWLADQRTLLVKLVPADAGAPPGAGEITVGPGVQETSGTQGESSTYEARDTLKDAHDEALFDHYGAAQLARVDAATLAVTPVGKPGIYTDVDAAPDGEHVLVTTLRKPYSHVTTYARFAHDVDVWDHAGVVVKTVARLPLADRVPVHGVPTGPRGFEWRSTEPATLVWAEALDGGDWKVKVPARDKVLLQRAPFSAPPVEVVRTEQRFEGLEWGESRAVAFLQEVDENRHWRRTFSVDVDQRPAKPRLLFDLSTDEQYKDPGRFVGRVLPNGAWVVRQDGDAVFLRGKGASPDGDRPFLDRLDLKTQTASRLFRSSKTALESFVAFTADAPRAFLTWHQSPTDPPNAFVRVLGAATAAPAGEAAYASTPRPLTHFPDPAPAVRAIKKRLVRYKRKDGTDLSFTLYTPPGYVEGTRVPAILYAYPLDYADAAKAGQVTGSQNTFTRLRAHELLLLAGYALIDRAAFPIVGDPKKAYDTYLEQLVADAEAAVDKAVEIGVADRERIGVTGHSHGALMTVNLLAHSPLFRAGVATSGSYNKTLTPFGFQNERRSVWEAQSVYLKASPFFYSDKIKLPLLIVHGEDDANPGTTPLQAVKLYEGVRGNGGTSRLVMLPHEPHWYAAMESNEHLVAEMLGWFDRYVKNAAPRK